MPNGATTPEEFAELDEAARLYENLRWTVIDFVRSHGMSVNEDDLCNPTYDYHEWYHDGPSVAFGTNAGDINFWGIRRDVQMYLDGAQKQIEIFAGAYQDYPTDGPYRSDRRLKSFYVAKYPLPLPDDFLPLFAQSLDVAWRLTQRITKKDLLSADEWQRVMGEKSHLLKRLCVQIVR